MNIDSVRTREIAALKESMDKRLGVGPGILYRDEMMVDVFHRRTGCEILLVDTSSTVDTLLDCIKKNGRTLQLFQRGLFEAFIRISEGEKGDLGVNAYIGDIGNKEFCEATEEIMAQFRPHDRHTIAIEIVEAPYGEIDGRFIDNAIWLREQGFGLAVDDYDLFGDEIDNVSEEILGAVGQHCTKIKLDWRVTKKLIQQKFVRRQLLNLRSIHSEKKIVAEGIRTRADILALTGIVDNFQISSYQ